MCNLTFSFTNKILRSVHKCRHILFILKACEAFRPVIQRNRKCCLSTPEVHCLVAGEDSILRSSAFRSVTDTVIFAL